MPLSYSKLIHTICHDRNQFPVIFVSYDPSSGLLTFPIAGQSGKLSSERNGGCLVYEPCRPGIGQGETVAVETQLNLEEEAVFGHVE